MYPRYKVLHSVQSKRHLKHIVQTHIQIGPVYRERAPVYLDFSLYNCRTPIWRHSATFGVPSDAAQARHTVLVRINNQDTNIDTIAFPKFLFK